MQHRWKPRILLRLGALLIACIVSHDAMGLVPWPASFDDWTHGPYLVVHARVEMATTHPSDRACARTYTATILSSFKGPPARQPEQKLMFGSRAGLKPGHSYLLLLRPAVALYGAPPALTQPTGDDDFGRFVRCNGAMGYESMTSIWEVFEDRVEIDVPPQDWPDAVPLQKIAPAVFVASRAVLFSYLETKMSPRPAE